MGTITEQIVREHLDRGETAEGSETAIHIDQTLTQDATGTMAYMQFEAIGIDRVKTELSVSYIDHNTLQADHRNPDDHAYLQSVADKYGIVFSRPGNGICHQLHLERFAAPGKTLVGSDSHTPTAGGIGCLAFGAGGLDVAAAMAGMPYTIKYPKILGIELKGSLQPMVSAKDVILEVLRILGVKGGVGYILEYFGDGVKSLSVPQRATITNMGTETGATSSIFPSDNITKAFLKAQNREKDWREILSSDEYRDKISINLSTVVPLAAIPHSPGDVVPVSELKGRKVHQICIGSCTNSSLYDMRTAAGIMKGKTISEGLHLTVSPGSRQVIKHLAEEGGLAALTDAGARILENACGPCIGMGAAPQSGAVSLRTFNRNFKGRSGTADAEVFLVSPETAAVSALTGFITDPRTLNVSPGASDPQEFMINDNMFIYPKNRDAEIIRGPNISRLPEFKPLERITEKTVLIKVGDNITTDHIMPAGAKILPLRSNIPAISEYVFEALDSDFASNAKKNNGGVIIAGENYGQGSSREHAALAPKYLGVYAVIAKSFARIHRSNLVNFGILPLEFADHRDYENIEKNDAIRINAENTDNIFAIVKGNTMRLKHALSDSELDIVLRGGRLPWIRSVIKGGV